MLFNKRFGRFILFASFLLFIIGSSIFFYRESIDADALQGKLNGIPRWMKNQIGTKASDEVNNVNKEHAENANKPAL